MYGRLRWDLTDSNHTFYVYHKDKKYPVAIDLLPDNVRVKYNSKVVFSLGKCNQQRIVVNIELL